MFLSPFYSERGAVLQITPDQASQFAKTVAKDFNPIHDPDAKRFCVPGDLLFALTLVTRGLYQNMHFHFQGMVGKEAHLEFDAIEEGLLKLSDGQDKTYLEVNYQGEKETNLAKIEAFVRSYVAFSGHNFIDILEPLMREHGVMVNPARPLIIYESMSFELDTHTFDEAIPTLEQSLLSIEGKRGDADLFFHIKDGDKIIGRGKKRLILSGLRSLEEEGMKSLTQTYNDSKDRYTRAIA